MKLEPSKFCPLIKEDCKGLGCSWFTQIRGTNPNTGQEVDEWGCAVTWLPTLIIETSQQQRSTAAAVESMRNDLVDATNAQTQTQAHIQAQIQSKIMADALNGLMPNSTMCFDKKLIN